MKLLGIISVGFDVTDQLLIRFFAFVRYWRKKWEYNETVHQLFIRRQEMLDFGQEGGIVQYYLKDSLKVWGTHETSPVI
jgi:hypothetical protein